MSSKDCLAVSSSTGMESPRSRRVFTRVYPSIRGIITSAMIRSTARRSSTSSASTPSPAHTMLNWCFSLAVVSRRMESSSSTSKMVAMPLLLSLRGGAPPKKSFWTFSPAGVILYLRVVSTVLYRRGQAPSKGRTVSFLRIAAPGKPSVNFQPLPVCALRQNQGRDAEKIRYSLLAGPWGSLRSVYLPAL